MGTGGDAIRTKIDGGAYREAVALCCREHGAALGRLCMAWLGSQAEAEEAAQETLVAAYRAMASYRGEASVRAWLFGIARKICARRLGQRLRRGERLRLVRPQEEAESDPEQDLAVARRAERIRAALNDLKPTEREAVVLRYQAGLSHREVAEACGIDEATARKRASRALAHLRSLLLDEVL